MQFPTTRAVLLALLCAAGAAQAQRVQPPPLPPGSERVRPDVGLNEEERKRYVRAHHHRGHHRKDFTKDDSAPDVDTTPGNSGNSNAGGVGNANGKDKK